MSDLTKVGPSMLNMDDVAEDLRFEYHHVMKVAPVRTVDGVTTNLRENGNIDNPVLPQYHKQIMKADDTDLVAGVLSEEIAVGYTEPRYDADGNPLVFDRTTIRNAMNLGDQPASYYATAEQAENIAKSNSNVVENYGQDIAEVRDELYQLKHELEKAGLIRNTEQSFGYNDIFRNGYKPYEHEPLFDLTTNDDVINVVIDNITLRLTEDAVKQLDAGDYIAIFYKDVKKVDVRQIKEIKEDGETIVLDEGLTQAYTKDPENLTISKTYGISRDGNFYFAREADIKIGDRSIYTGFDDDTAYKVRRPINKETSSYGYSFRIPEEKLGFLTKFCIQAQAVGMPTLTCYIIDEQDIGEFRNPLQAKNMYEKGDKDSNGEPKMHFFAASKPVTLDPDKGRYMVNFDFYDVDKESYPLLTRKDTKMKRIRYVAIIVGTYVDDENYANVLFLTDAEAIKNGSANADLEKNNFVYTYTEQPEKSQNSALTKSEELQDSDLYYEIIIKEQIKSDMEEIPRGIYSAKMKTSYPQGVSRARLMMRIKREGGQWFANISDSGVYGTSINPSFEVENKIGEEIRNVTPMGFGSEIRKPLELRENEKDLIVKPDMIIGNVITSGTGIDREIAPNKPLYVEPQDMVYRNAYIVSVKGKRYEFNEKTNQYEAKDTKKIYLKPKAIIRDGIKYADDVYSDRIIWEGDFVDENNMPLFFNELELQIYWERNGFSESDKIRKEQIGIIHDLVFSTDRATH